MKSISKNSQNKILRDRYWLFLAWVVFFSFSTCTAILFQKLVLPSIPSMHGGMGLLPNDATYFHEAAKAIAVRITTEGWSIWSPWPDRYNMGNVSLLAALYALFGINPLLMLPLNATMHALAGILLIACGWRLTSSTSGRAASVLTGALYIVFPTALIWYAQVHKDSYADLAYMLVFHGLLVIGQARHFRSAVRGVVEILLAVALIAFVRPQYISILVVMLLVGAVPLLLARSNAGARRSPHFFRSICFLFVSIVLTMGIGRIVSDHVISAKKGVNVDNYVKQGAILSGSEVIADAHAESGAHDASPASARAKIVSDNDGWQDLNWLPGMVNRELETLGRLHMHMLYFDMQTKAGSTYDPGLRLHSSAGVLAYLPRATLVALAAPFPSDWLRMRSPTQMVGVAETIVLYMLIPGFCWFLLYRLSVSSASLLLAAMAVLMLLGLANANLGNLHRIRYPFHFIPMLLGMIGSFEMFGERRKPNGMLTGQEVSIAAPHAVEPIVPFASGGSDSGGKLFKTAAWVMVISAMGYVGFFLRDIIMARIFGLGAALDAFQVGIILPTFCAAILLVPLTNAVVPEFTRLNVLGKPLAERWMQSMIGLSLCGSVFAAVICGALWWLQGRSGLHPSGANAVFAVAILILLLSSWVNIGNGLLNTSNAQRTAAIGQSLVPWPPIILLLTFRQNGGAVLVAVGMVLGQIVNLFYVIRGAHKAGFHLRPRFFRLPAIPRSFMLTYMSVVATSFLFGAAVPLGIALALPLGEGQAGAFALGYKLVVLTYAIASAITTAVVVPYFSRHFVSGDTARAHRGLVKFMHLSLLVSVPAAAAVFGLAEHIVPWLFGGGRFSAEDGRTVAAVVQFGSLQIPFMLTNLLIVRFSEASAKAKQALIVTLLAQAVTIVVALFCVQRFGVDGIALAGSVGVIAATITFIIFLIQENVLTWLDAGVSLIGWWLFLTICLCLYFDSTVGVLTAAGAFVTLILLALKRVFPDRIP